MVAFLFSRYFDESAEGTGHCLSVERRKQRTLLNWYSISACVVFSTNYCHLSTQVHARNYATNSRCVLCYIWDEGSLSEVSFPPVVGTSGQNPSGFKNEIEIVPQNSWERRTRLVITLFGVCMSYVLCYIWT